MAIFYAELSPKQHTNSYAPISTSAKFTTSTLNPLCIILALLATRDTSQDRLSLYFKKSQETMQIYARLEIDCPPNTRVKIPGTTLYVRNIWLHSQMKCAWVQNSITVSMRLTCPCCSLPSLFFLTRGPS